MKRSRISAKAGDLPRVTIPRNYELNHDADHARAARLLAEKLHWHGSYFGGATKEGYAFVWASPGKAPGCAFYVLDREE